MALLGYARTSTHDQALGLADQVSTLEAAGCDRVWSEHGSGTRDERPELVALLAYAREGDTILVTALDRLGRSLSHLVAVVNDFGERGVGFRSLREGISTTDDAGVGLLTFHIFGAIAQFEASLVSSRTRAGLRRAAEEGRRGGRRPRLSPEQVQIARRLYQEGDHTVAEIAAMLGGVGRSTIYRALGSQTNPDTPTRPDLMVGGASDAEPALAKDGRAFVRV